MTDCWVAPESLFDGQDIVHGQAVRIVDGRITEIAKTPDSAVRIKGCLIPVARKAGSLYGFQFRRNLNLCVHLSRRNRWDEL